MAYPIHGKVARIAKNSVLIDNEIDYTITVNVDLAEKSRKGQDWKEWLAGQAEWEGNMRFNLDPSNTEQKALLDNIVATTPGSALTDVVFRLEDAGDYLSGNIILTSLVTAAPVGEKITGEFSFKGTGALALTIA